VQTESLIEKIKSLPPERIAEVEAFIDLITQQNIAAARHEAIAAYAAEYGGITADLDTELEAAALEYWRNEEEVRR
jgi:hypothetical protein